MNSSAAVVAATAARVLPTTSTSFLVLPSSSPAQARASDAEMVFRTRCEARARLFGEHMIELQEAVDELQVAAEDDGLVDRIGQDEVQAIMASAFAPWRDIAQDYVGAQRPYRTPASTIAAFWWLVRLGDPDQLKEWLRQRPADAPTLRKLLEER